MTTAAPSGVVTFLFTDVEGSTRRWEADADGMRAALAAHDEVLRKAIEAHGGWLFKHTGDGVCAAFSSPRSAVDAAVAAQRALKLPVRINDKNDQKNPARYCPDSKTCRRHRPQKPAPLDKALT
jgi:class 3 adenylate cyclase